MDDIDIYRTASVLITQHGKDAAIHAAMRADEMLAAGDIDGQRVWQRVIKAIDQLLSEQPPEGSKLH